VLGIQILIILDPDLFGLIQILDRAMEVRGLIFQLSSQIEIRVLEHWLFIYSCATILYHYSFETIFKRKNNPKYGLI
jgi:hypothetical protein